MVIADLVPQIKVRNRNSPIVEKKLGLRTKTNGAGHDQRLGAFWRASFPTCPILTVNFLSQRRTSSGAEARHGMMLVRRTPDHAPLPEVPILRLIDAAILAHKKLKNKALLSIFG